MISRNLETAALEISIILTFTPAHSDDQSLAHANIKSTHWGRSHWIPPYSNISAALAIHRASILSTIN